MNPLRLGYNSLFTLFVIGLMAYWVLAARDWSPQDRFLPWLAGFSTLGLALVQLGQEVRRGLRKRAGREGQPEKKAMVMDLDAGSDMPRGVVVRRAANFFGWFLGLLAGIWLVGFSTAIVVFLIAFLKGQARANWVITLGLPLLYLAFMVFVFGAFLGIAWPHPAVEEWTGFSTDIIFWIDKLRFEVFVQVGATPNS